MSKLDELQKEIEKSKKWDELSREERPLKDAEKPVEFWIAHMERYLRKASDACYGTDKSDAVKQIRKAVVVGLTCLEYNE